MTWIFVAIALIGVILNIQKKWQGFIFWLLSAILAGVFSGPTFITPKFESHAIVYPANIEPYSDESETEQMLQNIFPTGRSIQEILIDAGLKADRDN